MATFIGMLFAVISGACDGSFGAMLKIPKKWEWENTWILYSITALALFPIGLAWWAVPDLPGVYRAVSTGTLLQTFLFGVGWGMGSVMFGLGLYMLGQSLAYTVMVGLIAVGGSLIPMLITSPEQVPTTGGLIIILSMAVTVIGVAFCGHGGKLRDDGMQQAAEGVKRYHNFGLAFLVCVGAGVFSCMFNLAFHFAEPISMAAAKQIGEASTSFRANTPIWLLVMLGGLVPNVSYCTYLLVSKGSWRRFAERGVAHYWLTGIAMGVIFAADITFYGIGASSLGKLGTTVAWLIMNAAGILIANFWGVITGEWHGAPKAAQRQMLWGSLILALSIVLVNYGDYVLPETGVSGGNAAGTVPEARQPADEKPASCIRHSESPCAEQPA
jgi:L-rhamnose-H+ transport protein